MKKLIPILLILCVLLTGCLGAPVESETGTTTGDKIPNQNPNPAPETLIKPEDVEKDPEGSVDQAIKDATDGMFDDEAGIMEMITQSLENGAVTWHVEGDTLFAMLGGDTGLKKLTGTLYTDGENGNRVIDLLVDMQDETLSNRLYLTDSAVALNSPWVFGAEGTYFLGVEKLKDDTWFTDTLLSLIASLAIPDGESYLPTAIDLRDRILNFGDTSLELPESDLLNDMLASMDREIKVEDVKDADGKTVPGITVSYQINNATLWSALEILVEEIELSDELLELVAQANGAEMTEEELRAALKETLESYIEEMNDAVLLNLTASVKINMLTAKAIGVEISGTVKDVETNTSETVRLGCTFASNTIFLSGSLEGEDPQSASLWLKKSDKDGKISYDAEADVNIADVEMRIGVGVSYESESGEFELRLTVDDPESDEDTEIILEGAVAKEAKQVKIALTALTVGELTIRFEISASFAVDAVTPTIPEGAVDGTAMSDEEWEAFVAAFEAGPLGQLIASMQEPPEEPDDSTTDPENPTPSDPDDENRDPSMPDVFQ